MRFASSITKVTFFSKAIALFLFFFFLAGSFLTGMTYQKSIDQPFQVLAPVTAVESKKTTQLEEVKVFPSPNEKKQILIREQENGSGDHEVILKENNREKKLEVVMMVGEVFWSPDSRYIVYSSGTPSAGYTLSIIDTVTEKHIYTDEQSLFLKSAPGPGEYDHVFSRFTEWRNNQELIIGVSGYTGEGTKSDQYYLINVKTEKIVKRLL
jgi:hypothetical protein